MYVLTALADLDSTNLCIPQCTGPPMELEKDLLGGGLRPPPAHIFSDSHLKTREKRCKNSVTTIQEI